MSKELIQSEWMDIGNLTPDPNNPRTISDENYQKLVDRLKKDQGKYLILREIIVDKNGFIKAGNQRYQAAIDAGLKQVPIKRAENYTEAELKEFMLLDNLHDGDWNLDVLNEHWTIEEMESAGMEIEYDLEQKALTAKEDNYEAPPSIETSVKPGDIIQIGPHRLICGDSTQAETYIKLMQEEEADLMLTDPPYNVNYEGSNGLKIENDDMADDTFLEFLSAFHNCAYESLKPGGGVYVFHADSEGLNFRKAFKGSGLLLKQCLIWVKNALVMGRQDYHWKHEPILYGWKPGDGHYFTPDRTKTTVIDDQLDYTKMKKEELLSILQEIQSEKTKTSILYHDKPLRNDVHPTMKPIPLVGELIQNSSKRKQIILDPFLGSGSTMVAAHQLQRRCYGIEMDTNYCQVIIDRMTKLDPELQIEINHG